MSAANNSQLSISVPELQSVHGQQHELSEQESSCLLGITECNTELCCNENLYSEPPAKLAHFENEKMKTRIFMTLE